MYIHTKQQISAEVFCCFFIVSRLSSSFFKLTIKALVSSHLVFSNQVKRTYKYLLTKSIFQVGKEEKNPTSNTQKHFFKQHLVRRFLVLLVSYFGPFFVYSFYLIFNLFSFRLDHGSGTRQPDASLRSPDSYTNDVPNVTGLLFKQLHAIHECSISGYNWEPQVRNLC